MSKIVEAFPFFFMAALLAAASGEGNALPGSCESKTD